MRVSVLGQISRGWRIGVKAAPPVHQQPLDPTDAPRRLSLGASFTQRYVLVTNLTRKEKPHTHTYTDIKITARDRMNFYGNDVQ